MYILRPRVYEELSTKVVFLPFQARGVKSIEKVLTMAFLLYLVPLALIQSCLADKVPFGENDVRDSFGEFALTLTGHCHLEADFDANKRTLYPFLGGDDIFDRQDQSMGG